MKVVVYTAITGGFNDQLREPPQDLQLTEGMGTVDFVCFTDSVTRPIGGPDEGRIYQLRPPAWEHRENPRRTARWHKLHPHELFPDADVTIWHDGSHQLVTCPFKLAALLAGQHMATFKHPVRKCVYAELAACIQLRKDIRPLMEQQIAKYHKEGLPANLGLYETSCVIRQRTPEVLRLNSYWWNEIAAGSLRDQLSLTYCMWKTGFRAVSLLDGHREQSPYFQFYRHR